MTDVNKVMLIFRSLVFNAFFFGSGAITCILLLPSLVLPRKVVQTGFSVWMHIVFAGLRAIAGLSVEIRGRENLPDGPVILACKHQSAWETGYFLKLLDDPAYILKRELLKIPVYGWLLRKSEAIAIDRSAGASALKQMITESRRAIENGRTVVLFPEGTRSSVGNSGDYHPGIAALYKDGKAPVVPVALNSGLFWPRRSFLKRPGKITLEFLPPMPEGLARKVFMTELENRIEAASNALVEEARATYPHALPPSPAQGDQKAPAQEPSE